MTGDFVEAVNEITPYVMAAAGSVGGAVLTQVQDEAVSGTVVLGRRILQRVFGTREEGQEIPEVLADVIDDPADPDNVGALRKAIRKALASDGNLAEELRRMLDEAAPAKVGSITASGERSVAAHTISGIAVIGDNNRINQ